MPLQRLSGEEHQQAHLTLCLPPRAHKTCTLCCLCKSDFFVLLPLSNTNTSEPLAMRCAPCRRSEKCSQCHKIKKKKHFKKGNDPNQLYKTCAGCHEKF